MCKHIRFHDLRHTFATLALENGMDIKTLSATIGHVSASTTIDIYSHITATMQHHAAAQIDYAIGSNGTEPPLLREETVFSHDEPPQPQTPVFKPYTGKIRKSGTGCITKINDHLWEGRFTPTKDGKRVSKNIYAHTPEECEEKLAELIAQIKAERKAKK